MQTVVLKDNPSVGVGRRQQASCLSPLVREEQRGCFEPQYLQLERSHSLPLRKKVMSKSLELLGKEGV